MPTRTVRKPASKPHRARTAPAAEPRLSRTRRPPEIAVADWQAALRLADVPPMEGVVFLDDPVATVLATCSIPRGMTAAGVAEAQAEAALAAADDTEASGDSAAEDGDADAPAGESVDDTQE